MAMEMELTRLAYHYRGDWDFLDRLNDGDAGGSQCKIVSITVASSLDIEELPPTIAMLREHQISRHVC